MLKTRKTMVSWQAFSSLPPRRPPRVSLAPKTPFLIPLKRLPRRLILQLTAKCSDNWNHSLFIISAHRWFIQFAHFIKSLACLFEFTDLSVQTRSRSSFSVDLPWKVYGCVCGERIAVVQFPNMNFPLQLDSNATNRPFVVKSDGLTCVSIRALLR